MEIKTTIQWGVHNISVSTGAAITTSEIIRNAKSVEQTGKLASTVDKAAKSGDFVMNGNTYKSGYSGGRWHSVKSVKAAKIATKTIAQVGKALPVVGVVASTAEFFTGDMDTRAQITYTADLAMTAVSVVCPVCGTVYFISRIFW